MGPVDMSVPRVTVVSAPACHFCDAAEQTLAEVALEFAIEVVPVAFDSPEGRRLVAEHRPALSPLVLLDGAYFGSGRLSRRKLVRELARLGTARRAEPGAASIGARRG